MRLELARSWILAGGIVGAHGVAAGSILTVMQGWPGPALAAGFVTLGVAAAWARALHGSRASVRAIELADSDVLLELKDGRRLAVVLGTSRHVSRLMVALAVRRPMRRTVLVTSDMLSAAEFRQLRLWALWGKLPQVACKQLSA